MEADGDPTCSRHSVSEQVVCGLGRPFTYAINYGKDGVVHLVSRKWFPLFVHSMQNGS